MKVLLVLVTILLFSGSIFAQSDLEIFGFYQVRFEKYDMNFKVTATIPQYNMFNVTKAELDQKYYSPYLQQTNIFFRKELSSSFTGFLNFEFVNNFSTRDLWGDFKIDEGWLNYEYSPELNIKMGYLIPKFNYLNEVKTRMPMLPYIIRPVIYESGLQGTLPVSDYLPEKAFLQVYGKFFLGGLDLNYAVYGGQSESPYLSNNASGALIQNSATDTSKFKMVGGRVGINYGELRLGVSATQDRDKLRTLTVSEDVLRYRYGADLGFSFENFFLDAEIIKVDMKPKTTSEDLNKLFYYATLEYDFNEEFFAYGTYSHLKDKSDYRISDGLDNFLFGGGYRALRDVVFKFQYGSYYTHSVKAPTTTDLDIKVFTVAASILF